MTALISSDHRDVLIKVGSEFTLTAQMPVDINTEQPTCHVKAIQFATFVFQLSCHLGLHRPGQQDYDNQEICIDPATPGHLLGIRLGLFQGFYITNLYTGLLVGCDTGAGSRAHDCFSKGLDT